MAHFNTQAAAGVFDMAQHGLASLGGIFIGDGFIDGLMLFLHL